MVLVRLLGEVTCGAETVAGARSGDLLAALALHPAGLSDAALVEEIWADEVPAAPAKALQVLVSRLRSQCGAAVIARYDGRYRLGAGPDDVDAWRVGRLAESSRGALLAGEPERALVETGEALALLQRVGDPGDHGPLAELRRRTLAGAAGLTRTRSLALSRCGRDAEALPLLERVHARDLDDVDVLAALLRSEAAAVGAPAALARFEDYRRDLADRLGVDPDDELRRLHRELLSADQPERHGIRYDADELLGRDDDLARLRSLVRTGRLTSILGPGGLGKTRIAHVLAREATQPRVHFVELVGISSPSDVVSEVGSALGVRNSVTGRRALTPAQTADVRARIAQELDTVPTLLVLDNCEHVLDAIASLVAFLLVTTRDLHVVTTTRAPLGIAAERVLLLSQLGADDGAELFCRRARSARPDAELPADVVADIVGRLDGLPLALELAAARVRAMPVEEVRRRLDDRFALLRSRDRTAHARHQTLTAVIAWSWDLLGADEQRALAWLSVFHDGFAADAAESLLGPGAVDLVEALVDQSLLAVTEDEGRMRFRMLETVREFGGQRLAECGEVGAARAAQSAWAAGMAAAQRPEMFGTRQFDAIDTLWPEENNLADVLRRALADGDGPLAVPLLATLGSLWAITGNHARVFAFADLAEQLLLEWEPPPELAETTGEAIAMLLTYVRFMRPNDDDGLADALARLGVPTQPWTRAVYAMFVEAADYGDGVRASLALADHPDPATAIMGLQWAAVLAENLGDIELAGSCVLRALDAIDGTTTPWQVATLHVQASQFALQGGDHDAAAEHARVSAPLLTRLRAHDDALHARTSIAIAAIMQGDLDTAQRVVDQLEEGPPGTVIGGGAMLLATKAELLLARGDAAAGLAAYDEAVTTMRAMTFAGVPMSGMEPWVIVAEGSALAAHVLVGETDEHRRRADELAAELLEMLTALTDGRMPFIDFPVTGMGVVSLGAHQLTRGHAEDGVRLLALADRFGYNRTFPVMAWGTFAELADRVAPGRLAAVLEEYGDRPGRELVDDLAKVLARVDLTSSG